MPRTRSRVCSVTFWVDYVNGEPFIQNAHIRLLGFGKDIHLNDDCSVSDLNLRECFDLVDSEEVFKI